MIFQLFSMFSIYSDLYFLIALLLLTFIIIPFIVLTFVAIWVYRDAKNKDLNAVVWVLVVWITPFFIGVIIYMINCNRSTSDD